MQNSTTTIKRLAKNDSTAIVQAAKIFYNDSISTQQAEEFLSNPNNYFLIAYFGNEIAGFVMGYQLDNWHKDKKNTII